MQKIESRHHTNEQRPSRDDRRRATLLSLFFATTTTRSTHSSLCVADGQDWDQLSGNDLMGRATVKLSKLRDKHRERRWVPLHAAEPSSSSSKRKAQQTRSR